MKKYSIVSYLEGEDKEKVRLVQEELSRLTGSRACLDNWSPHITVGDGIFVADTDLSKTERLLESLAAQSNSFKVLAKDFSGLTDRKGGKDEITTPYVLWVNVEVDEKLQTLVERVKKEVTSNFELWYEMPVPYRPHITLAFRDLTLDGYEKGARYLASIDFRLEPVIKNIALVEKTDTKDIEYKRFYLKG